jgi:hypothetical protein
MNKQEEIALEFLLLHKGNDCDNWLGGGNTLKDAYHYLINGGFGSVEIISESRQDYYTNKWTGFNDLLIKIDKFKSKSGNEEKFLITELEVNKLKIDKNRYPILFGVLEIANYAFCKVHLITDLKDVFHIFNGVYISTPEHVDFLIRNEILVNDIDKNNPFLRTKILSGI